MSNGARTEQHKAIIQEYVSQNQDISIQVPILGHSWSSCHSILHRLAFQHDYWDDDPTNNCEETKDIDVEGHRVTLILWVYEGNNYAFMTKILRKTNIFLLVYDVTDRNTFDHIKKFHAEVFGADQEGKPIWVCAGKCERPEEDWAVSAQEGEKFSTTIGARFMKYSGRTGYGLDDDFARQIATDALLDLAGVNYRGPGEVLQVRSAPKRWRLHLGAICEKVQNWFRKASKY